ncbi:MAG: hypothetical protein QM744_19680 [Mesorhizobium sp.]
MKDMPTSIRLLVLWSASTFFLYFPLIAETGKKIENKKLKEKSILAEVKNLPSGANADKSTKTDGEEDEISLVIKGKIISVTDKEIIYKETGSNTEGRAPIHNLHFLRRASGEYRFFTPAKTRSC